MKLQRVVSGKRFVLLAVATAVMAPGAGASEPEVPVRFLANAGLASEGVTSLFDIVIEEWTSEAERADLVAALRADGSLSIRERLQEKGSKGRIAPRAELGIDLRYAYRIERDGGSTIILAADRPIDAAEAIDQGVVSRTYDTTLVVLELDESGRGTGTMMLAAQLKLDEDGQIAFESASPDSVRLGNVRMTR